MIVVDSRAFFMHVRGMFSPEAVARVRQHLREVEHQRQAMAGSERERRAVSQGVGSDALRMDPAWFEIWKSPSQRLLEAIGPFRWISFPPQVRTLREQRHFVPWHQDIAYQQLLKDRGHKRVITCFVPLDEAPAERTTLEFCATEEIQFPHEADEVYGGVGIGGDGASALQVGGRQHFLLECGDALVFGDLAVHRTYTPPNGVLQRSSLENRLVRAEDALDDKDYFDIESGLIVRKDGTRRPWI
jgi:hypothetical protein